ncbi:MAG: Rrf2 family transcriptional regulator [Deltaproteobacteria bacterium]|jgi:Rrf2 family protein|nr:Rrf2 family transcriptional regulator [Deltaproteobacteria bacterium]
MAITHKSKYALRATLELAVRYGQGPTSIAEIAKAQAIPARFLEAILAQLKRNGLVESRRGNEGGYVLARPPGRISVGDVLRAVQGTLADPDVLGRSHGGGPHAAQAVFSPIWEAAVRSANAVYDAASFQILVDRYRVALGRGALDYSI